MTEVKRSSRALRVAFWLMISVVSAGAIGIVLLFTIVPGKIKDTVPEPHVVGSETPEIATRLGALSLPDKDSDDRIRDAAAVSGATATRIGRDGQAITVVVQLISPGPDSVCFSFAVPRGEGGTPVSYDRLPSCP